jgi:type II secretory pathway pseudopilin PulG
MKCSCPKCDANIQVDLPHIPENGIATPCPECNSRFWINKESFACRALKKEGKLYCAQCSNELNHKIVCPSCGVLFPDFCVVQTSKPVKRQLKKPGVTVSFSLRPAQQKIPGISTSGKTSSKSRKSLVTIVSLLMLVALLSAVGVVAYNKRKAEQEFTRYYILAVYGIKTGADLDLNQCAKLSADWRTKMTAGQNFQPRISPVDEARLTKVKVEVDIVMQRLDKSPKNFISANAKLAKLYGIYAQLHSLTLAPPSSLAGFTDSATKSENDFRQAVQEFKTALPTELLAEINKAKTKYKGLRDF